MRKYYRNRYTSFMDAIKNKKSEDDKAAELAREKQEKKAKRLKDKVLEQMQSRKAPHETQSADGAQSSGYSDDNDHQVEQT